MRLAALYTALVLMLSSRPVCAYVTILSSQITSSKLPNARFLLLYADHGLVRSSPDSLRGHLNFNGASQIVYTFSMKITDAPRDDHDRGTCLISAVISTCWSAEVATNPLGISIVWPRCTQLRPLRPSIRALTVARCCNLFRCSRNTSRCIIIFSICKNERIASRRTVLGGI